MSKASESPKDEKSGGEVLPEHLTLKGFFKDVVAELKHQAAMGAHEAAALLYRGDAFVMYGKEGKEEPGHGLPPEAGKETQQKEMDGPDL